VVLLPCPDSCNPRRSRHQPHIADPVLAHHLRPPEEPQNHRGVRFAISVCLHALLLTEKNFRTLGCICAARDFFVFRFLSLHFEDLELPRGFGRVFVSATGLAANSGDTVFLIFASRSTRLVSSRWSAALRALLGLGMRTIEANVCQTNVSPTNRFKLRVYPASVSKSDIRLSAIGHLWYFFRPKK
jgi:hypothetical protein